MGDGTEIPWDLSPGTRVPGLGLGLIFMGQSQQRPTLEFAGKSRSHDGNFHKQEYPV